MARVTLKTVAERVGVSPMTVSNAFSRPDQLSAALRERILAAAAELGYVGPDPAARTLARGRTGTVGILFHGSPRQALSDEFSALFLGALAEELGRGGLALTLLPHLGDPEVVPVRDVALDGAVVYSSNLRDEAVAVLRRRRLPLVFVDEPHDDDVTGVNVADRDGARTAAAHVVGAGHRRIAVVTVGPEVALPGEWHVVQERLAGWREGLAAAGIDPLVRHVGDGGDHRGHDAAGELLGLPEPPTAVLCFSDALAADVLQVAADRGLRVPRDLSVVGYDDGPLASRVSPALTTVRQDVTGKAALAARELVAAVRAHRTGEAVPVRHHVLPVELVARASTAGPPAAAHHGTNGTFVG